jgi:hypothetical protein
MTAKEMAKLIDKVGTIDVRGMSVDVQILDVRDGGWGKTHYQITPMAGTGPTWVDSETVYNIGDATYTTVGL